jgi:hypothetical protein
MKVAMYCRVITLCNMCALYSAQVSVLCVLLLLRAVNLCLLLCIKAHHCYSFCSTAVCVVLMLMLLWKPNIPYLLRAVCMCVYLLPDYQTVPLKNTKLCHVHHRWNSWSTD